jgi:hypothetical protein
MSLDGTRLRNVADVAAVGWILNGTRILYRSRAEMFTGRTDGWQWRRLPMLGYEADWR